MTRSAAEIFHAARELPADQRDSFLAGACDTDGALRARVDALLKADAEAGGFLASPTAGSAARPDAAPSQEQAGAQIGRYKLLEQIGEGGMGTIWMAEQREPVKRRVALKIIKLGMDTKQVIARFEAERQALAMMDHPHIAKVLDAGATETGRPYFVMEYIRGVPILQYCDTERLDTRARLDLFASVCQAIQHAHQKGIIHRDIKPSNVLVTLHDGVPVPKVIDFGIAKATNSELTTKTLFTEHRQMIGTPAYMSPEQAEMSGLDIDTRSDIYSLGVLLYELLTGTVPFDTRALLESGFAEMLRAIREDEPHKPSTRISTLGDTGTRTAQQRRVELKKLSLLLRGDLDWIVMKCLEKDRSRRYDTANGLAADIRRHLADEPVTAGAPSAAYKLRKFVKRNRIQVIAGCSVLAAVLAGIVGTSWGLVEKSRARSAQFQRQSEDEQRTAAESARLVRNAEAVGALLTQCEDALRGGDTAQAQVALDAARKRAAEGGVESDVERLARLSADLDLATELDAIDQFRWTWAGNHFGDASVAATRTREALVKFGADPWTVSVEVVAARVEASTIRRRIVASMDRLLGWADAAVLRAVLQRVDADSFRDAFRDAVLARDLAKLVELAGDPAALEQPAEFAAAVGQYPAISIERRRELLNGAVLRRPADISLLMTLQGSYSDSPDSVDLRVRWLQAAIAADPRNSAAYTNLGLALKSLGRVDEALACNRMAVAVGPENATAHNNLGGSLRDMGRIEEAIPFFLEAIELDPTVVYPCTNLGEALVKLGRMDEALVWYRKAIQVDPRDAYAHAVLGDALRGMGQVDEAIDSYRKAIELDPLDHKPRVFLGDLLLAKGQTDEAIACYRRAVELDPKRVWLLGKLGDALRGSGRVDEAITCYRKAIELDPEYNAYGSLGEALKSKGRTEEAIPCYRKAVELDPQNVHGFVLLSQAFVTQRRTDEAVTWARKAVEIAPTESAAHLALGIALHANGRIEESIPHFQKAIELDPTRADAQHNLGAVLFNGGHAAQALPLYRLAIELAPERAEYQLDLALTLQALRENAEALDHFRTTAGLDPKNAVAAYNIGVELAAKQRFDEAIDWYQKTIELDPTYAEAHCNLAVCLQNKGRFAEALPLYRRGHELGTKRADWRYPSAEWVRAAETRAALERKLPALLAGELQPADGAERLEYVSMCAVKGFHRAAVRLSMEAFAADPRLADDLANWRRCNAASSAAQASAGLGQDTAPLDEVERARLRKLSLDWLRADLALHAASLETDKPADRASTKDALRRWQEDSDLACIRDPAALAALPVEDRSAFARLWADVATLLAKAEAETTGTGPR